jgi:hypothetical protein
MTKKRKKILAILATVILLMAAVVLVGRAYLLNQIKSKLEERLHALRDLGYVVDYDSIRVDTEQNRVDVYRLTIKRDLDSALCATTDFFSASLIRAEGFRIMPLILKKQLRFRSLELDSPRMVLYENFFNKPVKDEKGKRNEFSIVVDHIKLPHINFSYVDSSSCNPNSTYTSNAAIEDFVLSFYEDRPPYFDITSFNADSIRIKLPAELYSINIKEARLNLKMGIFDLDTLRIIPDRNKIAFGREKEKETDRIEGVIPYINLYGLSLKHRDSITVKASKMTTQLFLHVFRDKRLPFKNNLKPLPIDALYSIPIGLTIDSLIVNKSFVEYEEFAEEADSSGRVYFDDIYASISKIDNTDRDRKGKTFMIAEGAFMGQGELRVESVMPWRREEKARVSGSLKNMDMARLNLILEPQVKMRAESGRLNLMTFGFTYNDDQSEGKLELSYNDLKIITFRNDEQIEKKTRKQKRKGHSEDEIDEDKIMKDPLKTFVVNTFILQKNIDGEVEEKRDGTIHFERDKRRSIFNYWAKSMFSGVKSAYNIDKLQDSRLKKILEKKQKD